MTPKTAWKTFYKLLHLPKAPVDDRTLVLLGELMYGAHQSYTDCGLGSAETDLIVDLVKKEKGFCLYGAKITGGGAGGTLAILGRDTPVAQEAFSRVVPAYPQQTGILPYVFCGLSVGADACGILTLDPI